LDADQLSRRDFLSGAGWVATCACFGGLLAVSGRYLVPNVLYEPPHAYKIGRPQNYPEGVNYVSQKRIFLIRQQNLIRVVSAVCTHIGCTISWVEERNRWECPCHGTFFNAEGAVIAGPAPRPLPWYDVVLAPDGRLFVDQDRVVSSQHVLSV
jgi:cytochrome b6-f complex iron-sulfur subunit